MRRFLDAASGLPLSEAAVAVLPAAFRGGWPDPTRRYPQARAARALLDAARASLARAFGVAVEGLFLAADFPQAVGWALGGFPGRHLLVGAVEDLPLLREADRLAGHGVGHTPLAVSSDGAVDPDSIGELACARPSIVVVQDINLEIGTRQPLGSVRSAVPMGTPLIVDVRGSLGRDRMTRHWDVALADAAMWGGPRGCAVMAVRQPESLRPDVALSSGWGGLEPAAVAVPAAVLAATALESTQPDPDRMAALSARLRARVLASIPDSAVVGSAESVFVTMFTFLYVAADELIDELARRGWAVASGASCTSDTRRPHHVLVAVAASTHGSLRVSLPPWADEASVAEFGADLIEVVERLRRDAGVEQL